MIRSEALAAKYLVPIMSNIKYVLCTQLAEQF